MLSQTSGQIPPLEHHPNMLITLLFLTLIKDLIPLVNNKIKQFLDLDAYHPKSLFTNIEPPTQNRVGPKWSLASKYPEIDSQSI